MLTSLALLSLLIAGAVLGAAVFLYADGRPPSDLIDALRPGLARVRDLAADARTAIMKQAPSDEPGRRTGGEADGRRATTGRDGPNGSAVGSPGAGTDRSRSGDATGNDARGTSRAHPTPLGGSSDTTDSGEAPSPDGAVPAPVVPPAAAETGSSRPGQLVVALDVGHKPVFSPSFASDGSAVFFDEETGAGGSALKEARTGSDKLLHVLSVLDDGARNYHPQLSPDGNTVAFDSDRDGVRGVYLSNRAGGNIRRVSGEGYAAVPTWSPNGRRLAFIKAEPGNARVWNVWLLDLPSGAMRRLTGYRLGQPWGASWFPDGRRICYSHEDRLVVLDTHTGATRVYPSPQKGTLVRTPAVSPDGRYVIFQLYRHGAWLLDLDDGSMRQVLDDPSAEEFAWSPDGSRIAFHSRRENQWGIRVMSNIR